MHKSFVLLTVVALFSGCGKELPPVPEPESRPAKLFTVSVGNNKVERQFPATSEAGDKAVLAFRVPGQLQSIDVSAGLSVKKGDVLATLNPDEYSLLAQQAQAQFRLADVQFQRYRKLRRDKVVSAQDFDQAKANHNSAKATLEQAQANLRYAKLIAPYDGTISLIPAENYEFVSAQQGVMNIQTNQKMKVIFQLPDHLLNRFSEGENLTASMTFDAFPETSFPLTFREIDTEADPKTGSYKVTMVMDRPSNVGVLPGMVGTARVSVERRGDTPVPETALMERDGRTYVWRVNQEGLVESASVTLNENRQVIDGLSDGDKIIISGVREIEAGIKVREWIKERGL